MRDSIRGHNQPAWPPVHASGIVMLLSRLVTFVQILRRRLARSSTSNRRAKGRGPFVRASGNERRFRIAGRARSAAGSGVPRPSVPQRLYRQNGNRGRLVDVYEISIGEARAIPGGSGAGVGELPQCGKGGGGASKTYRSIRSSTRKGRTISPTTPQTAPGSHDGIVFIGVAQEKAQAFNGKKVNGQFQFSRDKTVYVNHYYFYIDDADFGPLFLKACSYAPWSTKLCLNGHEWAKRQLEKKENRLRGFGQWVSHLRRAGLRYSRSATPWGRKKLTGCFVNGCITGFLFPCGRKTGTRATIGDLSIWQAEVSLTQIFDRPLRGREFFEEVIRDNLDLGRPDRAQLIFDRVVTKKNPRGIPDARDPRRRASKPAHQLQELRSETILGRRARLPDGRDFPEPERLCWSKQGIGQSAVLCKNSDGRSIGACWKSNASATTVV